MSFAVRVDGIARGLAASNLSPQSENRNPIGNPIGNPIRNSIGNPIGASLSSLVSRPCS